jgi:hypothetical protein
MIQKNSVEDAKDVVGELKVRISRKLKSHYYCKK